jgi:hypothetical protein
MIQLASLVFEWCMVRCESNNTKKHLLKRFLPMPSIFVDFLDAIVNVNGGNLHIII